eukprot:gene11067-biopygen16833
MGRVRDAPAAVSPSARAAGRAPAATLPAYSKVNAARRYFLRRLRRRFALFGPHRRSRVRLPRQRICGRHDSFDREPLEVPLVWHASDTWPPLLLPVFRGGARGNGRNRTTLMGLNGTLPQRPAAALPLLHVDVPKSSHILPAFAPKLGNDDMV